MLRILILLLISTQIIASTPTEKEGLTGNFDLGFNYTQDIDKTLQFNNVFLLITNIKNQ